MKQNEFWDKRSDKYDLNIRDENFFAPTIEKTKKLLNESDVVLDVGCATGEIGLVKVYRKRLGVDSALLTLIMELVAMMTASLFHRGFTRKLI